MIVIGFWLAAANLLGQNLTGISICVDPGHNKGTLNHGPGGLREADINMKVALFLKEFLKNANIDTVLLTRTPANTDSISLSQRERIANRFGVTWFHSIHHNATAQSSTNLHYTLLLYEELGNHQPQWPGQSDVMSNNMAQRIWEALQTSDYRVFGDYTFYGSPSWLGVLNDLQMPGELSEATFHSNPIEERKLRNPDFLRLEARGLYTAILDYFEAGTIPTGTLSGLVQDAESGKLVDSVEVRLLPLDTVYVTDQWKNGFYGFHDLVPGEYRIEVSKAGYDSAQATVQVQEHEFAHANFNLVSSIPPVITAVKPKDQTAGNGAFGKVLFKFSKTMDTTSVMQAFSIEPAVPGRMILSPLMKVFGWDPSYRLEFGTNYTVRISGEARDIYGHRLDGNGDGVDGDDYVFQFRTAPVDTTIPLVVDLFPRDAVQGVFMRQIMRVRFNHSLDPASIELRKTLLVTSSQARNVPLRFEQTPAGDGEVLSIIPDEPMSAGATYFVTIRKGMTDFQGQRLLEDVSWNFRIESNRDVWQEVTRFNDPNNAFANPLQSPESSGLVADSLQMAITSAHFTSDSAGLALKLAFEDTTGQAMLEFHQLDNPTDPTDAASIAVHGDSSGAALAFVFRDSVTTYWHTQRVDWYGWQTLNFIAARDSLQDENGFWHGLNHRVNWQGMRVSAPPGLTVRLVVDDAYLRKPEATVGIADGTELPGDFELAPLFPNPAQGSDATHIVFRLQRQQPVHLAVYDVLGRRVALLAGGESLAPGRHSFTWNIHNDIGQGVAAGVYFVRLQYGQRAAVRKLVILP